MTIIYIPILLCYYITITMTSTTTIPTNTTITATKSQCFEDMAEWPAGRRPLGSMSWAAKHLERCQKGT